MNPVNTPHLPNPGVKQLLPLLSLAVAFALALSGCASYKDTGKSGEEPSGASRYRQQHDAYPEKVPDVSQVPNAVPRYEPYSRRGNTSYQVFGKGYQVLATAQDFSQTGIASWYGTKFHGYHTSNGEVYDMYTMSAAHKTLPLPSFVMVRNLDNNKEVIVRVNDRGPFHEGRIIDLSYAAAYRLDMLKTGTAKVAIESIYFPSPDSESEAIATDPNNYFIQVMASKDKARLNQLGQTLANQYQLGFRVQPHGDLFRLQLGPLEYEGIASKLLQQMRQQGYPSGYLVSEPKAAT